MSCSRARARAAETPPARRRRALSHLVAFDDAPFPREHRGDVPVVGAVWARDRFEGFLAGAVRRDGANATAVLATLVRESRFAPQLGLILLEGLALAGFNVVDLPRLAAASGCAVLAVARRPSDQRALRAALRDRVPGGRAKWARVERAGAQEPCAGLWVQRAGLTLAEAERALAPHLGPGRLPAPLRLAHLAAGLLAVGRRGRRGWLY
ncbi:MAG: hypothetical protein BWX64_01811 [Acidobacteria bacterium ADurb.Bin051]|nr:MAG: hypothetical protein BWX64_01811 [Acidobacteria bacterium ADurb.Bin051]HPA95611.1 DUF99 family protein [Thermoanaerobaculia bacterium]